MRYLATRSACGAIFPMIESASVAIPENHLACNSRKVRRWPLSSP